MADQWRYRGRTISAEDVTFIRDLIARHPRLSRRKLSVKLCEAWQWRQIGVPADRSSSVG